MLTNTDVLGAIATEYASDESRDEHEEDMYEMDWTNLAFSYGFPEEGEGAPEVRYESEEDQAIKHDDQDNEVIENGENDKEEGNGGVEGDMEEFWSRVPLIDCTDQLLDKTFDDEEALIDHIRCFARRFGFGVSIAKSKYKVLDPRDPKSRFRHYMVFECCRAGHYRITHPSLSLYRIRQQQSSSKKGCPFRVTASWSGKTRKWTFFVNDWSHNHASELATSFATNRRLKIDQRAEALRLLSKQPTPSVLYVKAQLQVSQG